MTRRNELGLYFVLVPMMLLRWPADVLAQSAGLRPDLNSAAGISPSGTYVGSETDTIDSVTGALHLRIPLARLPQNRGGGPGFELALSYNSAHYNFRSEYRNVENQPQVFYEPLTSPDTAWRYSYMYSLDYETRPFPASISCNDPEVIKYLQYIHKLTLVTPDGKRHLLRLQGQGDYSGDGYYRCVSTTLRHFFTEFSEVCRLIFAVC